MLISYFRSEKLRTTLNKDSTTRTHRKLNSFILKLETKRRRILKHLLSRAAPFANLSIINGAHVLENSQKFSLDFANYTFRKWSWEGFRKLQPLIPAKVDFAQEIEPANFNGNSSRQMTTPIITGKETFNWYNRRLKMNEKAFWIIAKLVLCITLISIEISEQYFKINKMKNIDIPFRYYEQNCSVEDWTLRIYYTSFIYNIFGKF